MSVAVLLDNFITASSQMELEEKQRETESLLREAVGKNPLEPLLTKVQIEMNHIICTIQYDTRIPQNEQHKGNVVQTIQSDLLYFLML